MTYTDEDFERDCTWLSQILPDHPQDSESDICPTCRYNRIIADRNRWKDEAIHEARNFLEAKQECHLIADDFERISDGLRAERDRIIADRNKLKDERDYQSGNVALLNARVDALKAEVERLKAERKSVVVPDYVMPKSFAQYRDRLAAAEKVCEAAKGMRSSTPYRAMHATLDALAEWEATR